MRISELASLRWTDVDFASNVMRWLGHWDIWTCLAPNACRGDLYKYSIRSRCGDASFDKADPFAFRAEQPPGTASRVWGLECDWSDGAWMSERTKRRWTDTPVSVYEVHLGSWRHTKDNCVVTYRQLAEQLARYVIDMGFTHVELLPVMEHPCDQSWGCKVTGYFAPTGRFGSPQDLMFLIDYLHRHDIGVILDWPLAHFALEDHGLLGFDGTHLFDHEDDRLGYHEEWRVRNFNFGRKEVQSFLGSVAMFWLDKYHADGLRMDAVTSILYRDFARWNRDWVPYHDGGNIDWGALDFLRSVNDAICEKFPGVETFAEECTPWREVTRRCSDRGMNFGFRWDTCWSYDVLMYMSTPPMYRAKDVGKLTFRTEQDGMHENFLMALSHDEVCPGKRSLLQRMQGSPPEKFAGLRLLYGFLYAHPGKKLLFMGCEWGQSEEWLRDRALSWEEAGCVSHGGIQRWVRDLNNLYRREAALFDTDCDDRGFAWIMLYDSDPTALSFLRKDRSATSLLLAVFNFMPETRERCRVGVPEGGIWREVLSSDSADYDGKGRTNGDVHALCEPSHGLPHSIEIVLPGLSSLFLQVVR
jgi:1,4-alpha-glucan branching enzyme